jgi:UDP-GlcNAc:undecaprenyl-phosphate/decaprenyl-phosphate GlcNAc-1-phosphate transferase
LQLLLKFVTALSITAALIPVLNRYAARWGLTDKPGPRKVHVVPVPRVGGLAMSVGIAIPLLFWFEISSPLLQGLLCGGGILLFFGVWDDWADLHYGLKFLGQIAAIAAFMILSEVRIADLSWSTTEIELPDILSVLLTFVFLLGVTNAVNLSDGLDGLAGGTALLCLCAIAVLAAASAQGTVLTVTMIEAGAILGFLRFNTHPARVFMGDAGSQILGFSIGALAVTSTAASSSSYSATLPLLIVGLPILDTLSVMWRRMRTGQSPFTSDRNHFHHRLLTIGLTHAQAVAVIYVLQGILFLMAYFLRFESEWLILAGFAGFSFCVLITLNLLTQRRPRLSFAWRLPPELSSTRHWPIIAVWIMILGLSAYACMVIVGSHQVSADLIGLSVVLLILLGLISRMRSVDAMFRLERIAAYTVVGLLVYLNQTIIPYVSFSNMLIDLTVTLIGVAALVRLYFSRTRGFEFTALDLLVVFIALVVPNLPGNLALPPAFASGAIKAVVLLYVVEMLLTVKFKRPVPQAFVALTLFAIAARGLMAPGG